jgi:hypothetical protein
VIKYKENKKTILEIEIKQTIDVATKEIMGSDKALSDIPITLRGNNLDAPNLTMVDLPRITRVPMHG